MVHRRLFVLQHVYKTHFDQEKFSMSNYMRDLTRVVLLSSDALQADIQRIQILQKVSDEQPKPRRPDDMTNFYVPVGTRTGELCCASFVHT